MAQVIDTIRISGAGRQPSTGLVVPFDGDGLLVILEAREGTDVSATAGRTATIVRPDGTQLEWSVAGTEVRHGVPALYFAGLAQADVPRLSQITW
jgi:hypothetical protein